MARILSFGEKIRLLFTPDFVLEEIRWNRIRIRTLEKRLGIDRKPLGKVKENGK